MQAVLRNFVANGHMLIFLVFAVQKKDSDQSCLITNKGTFKKNNVPY